MGNNEIGFHLPYKSDEVIMSNKKPIWLILFFVLVVISIFVPTIVEALYYFGKSNGLILSTVFFPNDILNYFGIMIGFFATFIIGLLTYSLQNQLSEIEKRRFINENSPILIPNLKDEFCNWRFVVSSTIQESGATDMVFFDVNFKENIIRKQRLTGSFVFQMRNDMEIKYRISNVKIIFQEPIDSELEFYTNDGYKIFIPLEGNRKKAIVTFQLADYDWSSEQGLLDNNNKKNFDRLQNGKFAFRVQMNVSFKSINNIESNYFLLFNIKPKKGDISITKSFLDYHKQTFINLVPTNSTKFDF
jgi:hypothetical protein